MKDKILLAQLFLFIFITAAGLIFGDFEVEAASENHCEVIGFVEGITIARCVDPDYGYVVYANSQGFLEIVK